MIMQKQYLPFHRHFFLIGLPTAAYCLLTIYFHVYRKNYFRFISRLFLCSYAGQIYITSLLIRIIYQSQRTVSFKFLQNATRKSVLPFCSKILYFFLFFVVVIVNIFSSLAENLFINRKTDE